METHKHQDDINQPDFVSFYLAATDEAQPKEHEVEFIYLLLCSYVYSHYHTYVFD